MSKAKTVSRAKRSAAGTKRSTTRAAASGGAGNGTSKRRASSRSRSAAKNAATSGKADEAPGDLYEILPEGKLYYRIGEVSTITGVKAYVLRYWESEFRWMAPQKSRSKQRLYRRKDIEMVLLIRRLLYEERYTIAGARQRLRELGSDKTTPKTASAKTKSAAASPESPSEALSEADYRSRFSQIREELVAIRASL